MHYSLKKFSKDEVAQERLKIIRFYEKYGEKATKEAFGVDRKLVGRWKSRLRENEGELMSLVPVSTRPKRVRRSEVPEIIVKYIKEIREKHPRIGKEKIKPLLDVYCLRQGVGKISESTIGNIIKRHHFFYQPSGRTYHDPGSYAAQKKNKKRKRTFVRYSPKNSDYGHILSDTVERVTDGVKDYFYSAIDAKLKFVLTLNYKRHSSRNMKDFYHRFRQVYPCKIKDWQTDNGPENLGEFDEQLRKDKIPHNFSYPHCPRINSYIERYNRTIQEEFIDNHLDIINDKPLFNRALSEYLIFYNTVRPHKSLGLKSPIQYLILNKGMSHKSMTYTKAPIP
ncbi:integrase core domain-containing protein [Candidatus Auribacterota bacterium]